MQGASTGTSGLASNCSKNGLTQMRRPPLKQELCDEGVAPADPAPLQDLRETEFRCRTGTLYSIWPLATDAGASLASARTLIRPGECSTAAHEPGFPDVRSSSKLQEYE